MKKNIKIEWGGSKNTTILKMLREVGPGQSSGGSGGGSRGNPKSSVSNVKKEVGIPEKIVKRPKVIDKIHKIIKEGEPVVEVISPRLGAVIEEELIDPGVELSYDDTTIYKVGVPIDFTAATIDPEWAATLWGTAAETPVIRDTLTVESPGEISDVIPNPIIFDSKSLTSANLTKEVTSDPVMITGINRPIKISISSTGTAHNSDAGSHYIKPGAKYNINGGRWQSGEDEVSNGDMISLKCFAPEPVRSEGYWSRRQRRWWRGRDRKSKTVGGGEQVVTVNIGALESKWVVTSS